MFKVGEMVMWMRPLDEDYSYGRIESIKKSLATVSCTGYYTGITAEIHLKYIEKVQRGGGSVGGGKRYYKRSATKA